jgi:hypothetical protein
VSLVELKKERDRVAQQLSGLNAALTAFAGGYNGSNGKRRISAAGKKRIAAAQEVRWAKVRDEAKVTAPKRTMSVKSRAKIAAAQRATWAKFRKSKTSSS